MTQTRRKRYSLVLSRADYWMVWKCHGIPYFHFFLFVTSDKKNIWMRTISIAVMVIISKVPLYWYQQSSKFFVNIYEVHWQRHLKDTLQLKILQQCINIRTNSSLVNIMKRKCVKVPGKLSVVQKSEPVFWRAFHLSLYSSFSLKQT